MKAAGSARAGTVAAVLAFLLWGLFPLYWKMLATVPAVEVVAHRTAWGFVAVAAWVTLLGGTNVQSSAPEVRDIIERGVADLVFYPWGSVVLFGIGDVINYHVALPI